MHLVIGLFIVLGTLIAIHNPDPQQAALLHTGPTEHTMIWGYEVQEILAERYGWDSVTVTPGQYKIPQKHEMPIGAWCSRVPGAPDNRPADWDCMDYSSWAAVEMSGYAFGVIWDWSVDDKIGHMLNVFLIEDEGKVKVGFYEPQTCYWVDEPRLIDSVMIR